MGVKQLSRQKNDARRNVSTACRISMGSFKKMQKLCDSLLRIDPVPHRSRPPTRRAISSVGRAPRLHRGCRRFESVIAHHSFPYKALSMQGFFAFLASFALHPRPFRTARTPWPGIHDAWRSRNPAGKERAAHYRPKAIPISWSDPAMPTQNLGNSSLQRPCLTRAACRNGSGRVVRPANVYDGIAVSSDYIAAELSARSAIRS